MYNNETLERLDQEKRLQEAIARRKVGSEEKKRQREKRGERKKIKRIRQLKQMYCSRQKEV